MVTVSHFRFYFQQKYRTGQPHVLHLERLAIHCSWEVKSEKTVGHTSEVKVCLLWNSASSSSPKFDCQLAGAAPFEGRSSCPIFWAYNFLMESTCERGLDRSGSLASETLHTRILLENLPSRKSGNRQHCMHIQTDSNHDVYQRHTEKNLENWTQESYNDKQLTLIMTNNLDSNHY